MPIKRPKRTSSIFNIPPMLATLVDRAPQEEGWLFEIKWDGYRAIAHCHRTQIDLISRNNKSFNDKFYPLVEALRDLKLNAILDGEIVVVQEGGVSSFQALQNWRSEADGELIYYVFDLLWLNNKSLMDKPLSQRKKILDSLIPVQGLIRKQVSFYGKPDAFLLEAKKYGLEGILAKKLDSTYIPGIRSLNWLKIKIKKRQEVVIGGYTYNENSPKLFSSLLVGVFERGKLHYLGKVGTGFNQRAQKEMMAQFKPFITKKCPFSMEPEINNPSRFRPNPPTATVTWLSPKLVCEVNYAEISRDGLMRHASFVGMREDKEAKSVHAEKMNTLKSVKITTAKKHERKTLLNPKEETQTKDVSGHTLKFNHLSKIFWPKEMISKRDLLNYYYRVAPYIVPYLKNRPQSLNRFPNGIYGESFYQKDVTKSAPGWIKQFPYHTSDGKDKNYLVVQDEADLLWMANLGAIEMNPWNSTIEKPDYPDWCIIDIDPSEENTFSQVIETAKATEQVLKALQIKGYCKNSGSTGLHIYIPLGSKYTYSESQLLGRGIATVVHQLLPQFTSIERYTIHRQQKVYVDFLQNRPKATLAAPYSLRPKEGAPVSMPIHWEEVKKGLNPLKFTINNAYQRILSEGDLFLPVLGKGINLKKALKSLETLLT